MRTLAGTTSTAATGLSASPLAPYSQPPTADNAEIEEPLLRLANHQTIAAAIGTVLALVATAVAFIIAAVYPALNGLIIAAATGMLIGAIALAVAIAIAVPYRHRLPSNNDAWVFW